MDNSPELLALHSTSISARMLKPGANSLQSALLHELTMRQAPRMLAGKQRPPARHFERLLLDLRSATTKTTVFQA